jgi:hypothetical protein
MSDGPRSTCGGSVLKLGGLSDTLLAHHDDVGDAEYYGVFFAARAWLGEIDRAAEDGGAYLRGRRCLIQRDALAWNLETDDAAPPIYRESPCSG